MKTGVVDVPWLGSHIRVLYRVPLTACSEVVAFPGDGVPWPSWPVLPGASSDSHPHSGGLLAALAARSEFAASALFVLEPGCVDPFAIYDNILPYGSLTECGDPQAGRYEGTGGAAARAINAAVMTAWAHAAMDGICATLPVLAIGFSKGGVVLNQILAELAQEPAEDEMDEAEAEASGWLRRLRQVHYLDVGVQTAGAHLTQRELIAALGRRAATAGTPLPAICVHGTPRQWRDPSRPSIRGEMILSVDLMREAGLQVHAHEYLEHEPRSMAMHFDIVRCFAVAEPADHEDGLGHGESACEPEAAGSSAPSQK